MPQAAPAQPSRPRVPLPAFPLEPDAPLGQTVFFQKLLDLAEEIKDLFDIHGVSCDQEQLNKELMVTIMQCMEKQKGHRDWWFKIVYNTLRNPPKDSPHLTEAHHLMLCGTRREALRLWTAEFESYHRLLAMSRFAQEGFPPICAPPAAASNTPAAATPSSSVRSEPSPATTVATSSDMAPSALNSHSSTGSGAQPQRQASDSTEDILPSPESQPSDSAAISAEAAGQSASSSAPFSSLGVQSALETNAAGPSCSTQIQPKAVPQVSDQSSLQQQPLGHLTGTAEPVRSPDVSLHALLSDLQPVPPMAFEAGAPPQQNANSAPSPAQSANPASSDAARGSLYASPHVTFQHPEALPGPDDVLAPSKSSETMQMSSDPGLSAQHPELPSSSGTSAPAANASYPGTAPSSAGHTVNGVAEPINASAGPAGPNSVAEAASDAGQLASGAGERLDTAHAAAAVNAASAAQSHKPLPGNDHIIPAPATPDGVRDSDRAPADAGHPAGDAAGSPQEPVNQAQADMGLVNQAEAGIGPINQAQAGIGPVDQAAAAMDAALASQTLRLPPTGGRITTEQLQALGRRLIQQQQPQPPGTNPNTVRTLGAAAVGHQAGPPSERIEVGTALVREFDAPSYFYIHSQCINLQSCN